MLHRHPKISKAWGCNTAELSLLHQFLFHKMINLVLFIILELTIDYFLSWVQSDAQ